MSLVKRPEKITQRYVQVLSEKSQVLINLLNWNPEFEEARRYWHDTMRLNGYSIVSKENVASWGKPNICMNKYESAPGVWVFDDIEDDATWMIWTDLHHKNAWKGTSFEIYVPPGTTGTQMVDILKRFVEFLKIS